MKQTEGTETANVSFDLGAATMNYGNNAPYFQWGRKDPMVPSTGLANANKAIYGTYAVLSTISTTNNPAYTIRVPYSLNSANEFDSYELWNVGNTETTFNVNPVTKSIYDPSPVGFHLPPTGAFRGWNSNERSYWQNTARKQGLYIYQLGSKLGNATFFPALGEIAYNYSYNSIGVSGFYQTAGSANSWEGYRLFFSENNISVDSWRSMGHAFSVRPVAE